mmetsp:Transcript_47783/g.94297  ORF Transcript_47783/g.94297 Transcript_47783/m.94297 type:complete len:134 (+) Transcript_47783:347-748(+)
MNGDEASLSCPPCSNQQNCLPRSLLIFYRLEASLIHSHFLSNDQCCPFAPSVRPLSLLCSPHPARTFCPFATVLPRCLFFFCSSTNAPATRNNWSKRRICQAPARFFFWIGRREADKSEDRETTKEKKVEKAN